MSDIGSGDEGISSQSTYLFTVVYRPGRLASRARCVCSLGQTPRSYKSKYLIVPVSKWRIQFGCESGSAAGEGSGAARRAGAAGGSAGADWGPTGEVVDLSIFLSVTSRWREGCSRQQVRASARPGAPLAARGQLSGGRGGHCRRCCHCQDTLARPPGAGRPLAIQLAARSRAPPGEV